LPSDIFLSEVEFVHLLNSESFRYPLITLALHVRFEALITFTDKKLFQ